MGLPPLQAHASNRFGVMIGAWQSFKTLTKYHFTPSWKFLIKILIPYSLGSIVGSVLAIQAVQYLNIIMSLFIIIISLNISSKTQYTNWNISQHLWYFIFFYSWYIQWYGSSRSQFNNTLFAI